jgi:digeranylgeranylglycerophospholipid reductase
LPGWYFILKLPGMSPVDYDITVIGSGPAGSTTARLAAERGLKVLLIDKRQELGAPIQCSGALSAHALEEAGVAPDDEFVLEPVYGFAVYHAGGERTTIDYRLLKPEKYGAGRQPLGYVVDRRRFDRHLMTLAERAGVEVWLKAEGLGYKPLPDGTCELRLRHFNRDISLRTRVVVGADGLQSQVGKWAGLRTHIKITELASCLQFVADRVETDGLLEIITGHAWAPGGYAWVFPKGHGYAEVGLGVISTMTPRNAQWHLDHFIRNSFLKDRLQHCRVLEVQGGGVPLAAPLRVQYAQNMVLVGDAARHVNPITGGGIHTALTSGLIAGQFLSELIQSGRPADAARLRGYQDRWLERLGRKMWQLHAVKTAIFKTRDVERRDRLLYETMADYFSPFSAYKKI